VVTDPSDSPIPDAQVTATEQGTEFSGSSRNLHDGSDHIPMLPPVETMQKREKAV
jgi:hypothetical protein